MVQIKKILFLTLGGLTVFGCVYSLLEIKTELERLREVEKKYDRLLKVITNNELCMVCQNNDTPICTICNYNL